MEASFSVAKWVRAVVPFVLLSAVAVVLGWVLPLTCVIHASNLTFSDFEPMNPTSISSSRRVAYLRRWALIPSDSAVVVASFFFHMFLFDFYFYTPRSCA